MQRPLEKPGTGSGNKIPLQSDASARCMKAAENTRSEAGRPQEAPVDSVEAGNAFPRDAIRLCRQRLLDPSVQKDDVFLVLQRLMTLQVTRKMLKKTGIRKLVEESTRRLRNADDVMSLSTRLTARWNAMC